MLSAASGVSGGSSGSPYGSFYLYGVDGSGSMNEGMHKVAPLHIPTTDTMLVEHTRYQVIGSTNTMISNVVAVNKETNAQTALFISDHSSSNNYPFVVHQWFADVENNGDYYIAFLNINGVSGNARGTVQDTNNDNYRHSGCVLVKYNKSHVQQWRRAVFDEGADPPFGQGYMPFFFFKGTELFVALSTYSDGTGFLFGRLDKSDGSTDGATSHTSDSGGRNASLNTLYGNRIYDSADNKLYLGGYHIFGSSFHYYMEKFTPSTTAGGFVNDYRKKYVYNINSRSMDHSFVVDDSHIWSCNLSGGNLIIRQRLKSDFSWVSGYEIRFVDQQISNTSAINASQIIQHPTDSNYLIGACFIYPDAGYYRYAPLFKFNKTTKVATIIDIWRAQSSSPTIFTMSGLTSDDTSVQVGWWFNNNQTVLYHLDIDDIENETLATTTSGVSNWYNRRANATVSTASVSAPTHTNETTLTIGLDSSNHFKSIADTNSQLTFLSGNTMYSGNGSL